MFPVQFLLSVHFPELSINGSLQDKQVDEYESKQVLQLIEHG
jgi:hypothetical protein